jgi:hypothetical protein
MAFQHCPKENNMNLRALVLSSAAALSFSTVAQSADAIVAAEPEPMEYVRVCDAFGTGFFYIPGTETCLKIGGYVRFQTNVGEDESGSSDWNSFTRAQLDIDARSDTEFGALRGFIGLRGDADNTTDRGVNIDQAFIEVAGLKVGFHYTWWDDDLSAETDILSSNDTRANAIRYTYTSGAFFAGVGVEELEALSGNPNNVGVSGIVGLSEGPVYGNLLGSYDTDTEEGAIRAIVYAQIGPGTLGVAGAWASGANAYYEESEWTVAAEYAIAVNDKLSVTPAFQYFGTVDTNASGSFVGSRDAWRAGLTVDYKIAENLSTKVTANYQDVDGTSAQGGGDSWTGFFRLQRAF